MFIQLSIFNNSIYIVCEYLAVLNSLWLLSKSTNTELHWCGCYNMVQS